jgi:hypothetical protein
LPVLRTSALSGAPLPISGDDALMGHVDDAEPLYTDAVARIRHVVGDDNPRTAAAMLGDSEFLLKRHKPAVAHWRTGRDGSSAGCVMEPKRAPG